MTENQKKINGDNSDEIDLFEILAKIILAVKKNFASLIVAILLGSGLGAVFYLIFPKVYESKMILFSGILTESYCERISESLDNLIKEENVAILSQRIGITEIEANSITKIRIEKAKPIGVNGVKDEKDNSNFIVTVRTKNKLIFTKIQQGLISYLRNNEYVKIRVQQRESYYKAMIEKFGQEINSLDSLKKRLFVGKPIYAKTAEMMLLEPTSIYSKIIELNKEQINYKNELELVNTIQLVEGFTVYNKPVIPKLSVSLATGATLGLFLLLAFMGVKALRKIISLSEEKLGKN